MWRLVVASQNQGKIKEMQEFFSDLDVELIPQNVLGIDDAVEDAVSFVENALIKARHVAQYTDLAVIADDSGIIIDALDGEPGVISARYAGPECDFNANIDKVITNLKRKGLASSPARFYCAIVLLRHGVNDPAPQIFTGIWEGTVVTTRAGDGGFGYDPIFVDVHTGKTAAELGDEKARYSHRVQALNQLLTSVGEADGQLLS